MRLDLKGCGMTRCKSCWRFVAMMVLQGALTVIAIAQPPLLDELRASVERWTVGAGSVIFSMEPPEGSKYSGRSTFGFDPATGAWFSATQADASGRTPDGVWYSGTPDSISVVEPDSVRFIAPMQSRIPMALPLALLKSTDGLVDVSKDADSNWVIEHLGFAPPGTERPRIRTWFSTEGRPLRFEIEARPDAGLEAIAYDYEFEPNSREPLLITVDRTPRPEAPKQLLVEVDYYTQSRPELFTTEVVLTLAVDNRMRSQMRLNALAAHSADLAVGDDGSERASYVDHRLSRAGWPLIVTGIVVVGIGLFVLIRKRAA